MLKINVQNQLIPNYAKKCVTLKDDNFCVLTGVFYVYECGSVLFL